MPTVKQVVQDVIASLPDDCTWNDVYYHLAVARSVMLGIEDIDAGRVITLEEMERKVGQWQKLSGPAVPLSS